MASRDRLEAASECIKPGIVAQAVRCLRPVVAPAVAPGAPGPGHATAAVKYGCSDADVSRSAPLDSCRRRTRFGLWYPCPPCLLASLPPCLAPATPVSSPAASARRCSAAWSRRAGVDVERQREEGHEAGDDYLGRGKQSEGTRRRKWIALRREQRSVRMAGMLGWLPLLMVPTRHQCRLAVAGHDVGDRPVGLR